MYQPYVELNNDIERLYKQLSNAIKCKNENELIQHLSKHGVNFIAQNQEEDTPLHLAVKRFANGRVINSTWSRRKFKKFAKKTLLKCGATYGKNIDIVQ